MRLKLQIICDRGLDNVYKPRAFEGLAAVVASDVAARLDPNKRYGIWWFNRRKLNIKPVSEPSENGCRYRKTYRWHTKPKEPWIAVPVLDSGIPRELVDAAWAAIKENGRISHAGRRFWELTGGIARCKECELAMNTTHSTKTKKGRLYAYDYYRCSSRNNHGVEACPNSNRPRAQEIERRVWAYISERLNNPEQLREDL